MQAVDRSNSPLKFERMPDPLPPHYLQLVAEAALRSFWRRQALNDLLRRSGVAGKFLSTWSQDESKRDLLNRLFPLLESAPSGPAIIARMATALAEQKVFPDLEGWEDCAEKKQAAHRAVAALREYLQRQREEIIDARSQAEGRKRAQASREREAKRKGDLENLAERLNKLAGELGSQVTGYEFQSWFYDLTDYFEVVSRRPYMIDGRQIDGSVTVDGTTYLVELKFTREQADANDIDIFFKKVHEKADNTMGIMVSMSGYSSIAIREASKSRTPLLLADHSHIYLMLQGGMRFPELIGRLRRHSSQTTQAYLHPKDFGG